jgi:hypothetical protein
VEARVHEQPAPDGFEAGRTDSAQILEQRLPAAGEDYLRGALENPDLDDHLAEVLCGNPAATVAVLERVAGDDRFRRSDAVKRALVLHPSTPPPLAVTLVKFVPWRDLLGVMEDRHRSPALRNAAEQTVGDRLNQLPPMEQARLARTAGRGIVPAFLRIRNPRVMQELLLNPRVVERDVAALARDPNTPGDILGSLARSGQWSKRAAVRSGLLTNISTPLQDAIRLVASLGLPELRRLASNVKLRTPLRAEAERQLRSRQNR